MARAGSSRPVFFVCDLPPPGIRPLGVVAVFKALAAPVSPPTLPIGDIDSIVEITAEKLPLPDCAVLPGDGAAEGSREFRDMAASIAKVTAEASSQSRSRRQSCIQFATAGTAGENS